MLDAGKEKAQQQSLFSAIAREYDLVNHIMTGWQDNRWRRYVVKQLQLPANALVLDIGSGNGQIVDEINRHYSDCTCIAADLTREMMVIGRQRSSQTKSPWVVADTGCLPFTEGSFHGVISGFLIRNLEDVSQGLKNQYRVLRPGGRIAVLDTSRPPDNILAPVIRIYMKKVIPFIGGLITGNRSAYQYLNDSTVGFLSAEELAAALEIAGFRDVGYRQFAFGMISVLWGVK
jgi:demethylmenaquinone methyltransferase/2-methoxy-6-polyprenyl-1,4-benzoquinol methylase